jgi:hypothetical protein
MRVLITLERDKEENNAIIVRSQIYAARGEEIIYALERHSGVNGDETSDRSHGERDAAG